MSSAERRREGRLPDLVAGADVIVDKLVSLTANKRKVQKVDFDELFARGLAISGDDHEDKTDEVLTDVPMIKFQEETGITMATGNSTESL